MRARDTTPTHPPTPQPSELLSSQEQIYKNVLVKYVKYNKQFKMVCAFLTWVQTWSLFFLNAFGDYLHRVYSKSLI